jgi:hypothetical protein
MKLPPSPFAGITLAEYASRLRRGAISASAATATLLARIDALQPRLHAFTFVDHDGALAQAAAIDRLFAAGIDLGPLMGVPVALKDLFSVDGMPTTAGSQVDIADLVEQLPLGILNETLSSHCDTVRQFSLCFFHRKPSFGSNYLLLMRKRKGNLAPCRN